MSEITAQQDVPLVLVVDDDRMMRRLVRHVLEPQGYAVEEAEDGVQALSAYQRLRPDLVLLDILMPVMDGFAACARLRALPGGDRTPVLMITALDDREAVDRAFEAGATDYVTKPIHWDVLRHRVRNMLHARQAEDALRESEEKYRLLVEYAGEAIFTINSDGVFLMMNSLAAEQLDGKPNDFVGKTMWDLFSKDVADLQMGDIRQAIHSGVGRVSESMSIVRGEPRWYSMHIQPRRDSEGVFSSVQAIAHDITERKRMEEALRESEERFRTIVETAPSLLVITDAEGNNTYISPNCEEIIGYTQEELLGRVRWWVHEDDTPRMKELFDCTFRDGVGYKDLEYKAVKKNGELWYASSSWEPFGDEEGKFKGIVFQTIDITERRRIKEHMRRQDRMAAIGQLAGGIAHDFNNILTGITLSTQMLLGQRNLPRGLVPDLKNILDDAQRAAHLVQQILDFSRRSFFETRHVDLSPFIQDMADVLRRTLPESIRFLLEVGADEYVVDADPTRLQQVLVNLATNARDAMPEGGELRLALTRVKVRPGEEPPVAGMDAGEWVCLAVSDTGSGMPPDVMSHLFEPFFTTKPVGQGTGLGLAQVHGIVKQHGGHIGVGTEVGQGTTFRIYLPAQKARGAEDGPQEEVAVAAPEVERATILLVEDEERVRKLGRRALEHLGYRVLTAADGREALEVYRSAERAYPEQGRRVELVLTDMVMPEMGGRELMRELRKMNPRVKGVAIIGYALKDDLRELREEGILDVVHKPFDVGTLDEAVRRALDSG